MAITLTEINNTLISMVDEQRETKSVMQSIADKITASAERDEKARLKFLNNKGSGASAGNIRSAAPSAAGGNSGGLLGGMLGGLGGKMLGGAAGIAGLGLALPAFFGGLIAGDAAMKWLDVSMDFGKLKEAAIGFTNIILEMDPKALVVLGGMMGISAVGGTKAAKGLGAMGFAISAFLGGLLAGDLVFSGVKALGGDLNFDGMKSALGGFSGMIMSMKPEAITVMGALMGISALAGIKGDGKSAAIALGAMGIGITAFLGGLLLGDQLIEGASALGMSMDFGGMKSILTGFSDSIGALTPAAATALVGILGAATGLAVVGKGPKSAANIAANMTGIGAGIAGFMTGLAAGDAGITWLQKTAGADGSGLKSAFSMFNDSMGVLDEKSVKALAVIVGVSTAAGLLAGGALGVRGALGIAAIMTGVGAGISGLFIGLAAGGKIVDVINKLPTGGDGFVSVMRMFNDSILAITPDAIGRLVEISNKKIGGGLYSLGKGMAAFFGAKGLGEIGNIYSNAKDAIQGAVNFIFGTNFGEGEDKGAISQIIRALEPIKTVDQSLIEKMGSFGDAINDFAMAFQNLSNLSGEKASSNLSKMVKDLGGVLSMWPHLTGDNPEPFDPRGWKAFGKDKIDFGGGLKNIKPENIEMVSEGVNKLRIALGVNGESGVKRSGGTLTESTSELMQQDEMLRHLKDIRDGINRMAGGNVSMNDNSTTVTNNSGIVMPRGATVDLLDGGLALGVSGPR
jgi:hypothetical protein